MGAAQTQPMTVAARIEIVTAGRPEPGQSQILTKIFFRYIQNSKSQKASITAMPSISG